MRESIPVPEVRKVQTLIAKGAMITQTACQLATRKPGESVLTRLRRVARHPVIRNAIALYWMQIATFIVPLITIPYLARVLGPSAFGLVVFSQGFAFVLVVLIDWGFGFTGLRSTAESQTDTEELVSRRAARARCAAAALHGLDPGRTRGIAVRPEDVATS